jgi:hypothetical protein
MEYKIGSTVEIYLSNYTQAGALADVTSALITITDKDGTAFVTGASMVKQSTGKYSYFTAGITAPVGWWTYKITVTDTSGYVMVVESGFEVIV